jgi:hypothetical protein
MSQEVISQQEVISYEIISHEVISQEILVRNSQSSNQSSDMRHQSAVFSVISKNKRGACFQLHYAKKQMKVLMNNNCEL